jgi:hypothetical protein
MLLLNVRRGGGRERVPDLLLLFGARHTRRLAIDVQMGFHATEMASGHGYPNLKLCVSVAATAKEGWLLAAMLVAMIKIQGARVLRLQSEIFNVRNGLVIRRLGQLTHILSQSANGGRVL